MRTVFLKAILPAWVRDVLRGWINRCTWATHRRGPLSTYKVLEGEAYSCPNHAWQDPAVARRQHAAFVPLVRQMREGTLREDFVALIDVMNKVSATDPLVAEVGCGSAWNKEVLLRSQHRSLRYVGVDVGLEMLKIARLEDSTTRVLVGTAEKLPLKNQSVDVVISGTVLMHLLSYETAIHESRRVTKRWCIFHTVPVLNRRATTILQKEAYGQPTVEVIFNEADLREVFQSAGLAVREVASSLAYDLRSVLGEPSVTKTFLCEVVGDACAQT